MSMVPKILPQTSFEACILRAILSVQSCGTWQLEHIGAHAGAVGVVDRALELGEHVVAHLVAAGAERLGVGDLHRRVERAPEHDAADEAAERQEAQAEVHAGPADDSSSSASRAFDHGAGPAHFSLAAAAPPQPLARSSTSRKALPTSGRTGSCATWHCMQK